MNKYFEILGLNSDAPQNEIKVAYRDLARVWHPDRFSGDPRLQAKAQEKLKEINEAYEKLKNYKYEPKNVESESRHQTHQQKSENTNSQAENKSSETSYFASGHYLTEKQEKLIPAILLFILLLFLFLLKF